MLKTCNEFGDALKIYAGHLKQQKLSDEDDTKFDMLDFMGVVSDSRRFEAGQRSRSVKYFSGYFDNEQ